MLASNGDLKRQITNDNAFAQAGSGLILDHLLDGKRVVIVTAPGADGQVVSGVTAALHQAGAHVTGQVALQQAFFGPQGTQSNLVALAQQLVPPGVSLIGQGTQASANPQIAGQQDAAQVIAAALVTKDGPGLAAASSRQILSGFAQHGFLDVSTPALAPATLAVVVIPGSPPAGGDSDPANLALLALAEQLDTTARRRCWLDLRPDQGPAARLTRSPRRQRDPVVQRGQRQYGNRPDHGGAGAEPAADRAQAGQLWRCACRRPEPGAHPGAVSEPVRLRRRAGRRPGDAMMGRAARRTGRAAVNGAAASGTALRTGALAAGAARAAYAALNARPPGGQAVWTRTNHRGEPVTLLEGPAVAAAAVTAAVLAPGLSARGRAALAAAGAGPRRSAATTTWPGAGTGADSAGTSARWLAVS